jgi:rod shape-determining protein MreC
MALYSRPRNTRLLVVSLVMVSLLTITVDYRGGDSGPLESAGRATLTIVGALQSAVSRVIRPIGDFVTGLVNVGSLRKENERLRQQVEQLQTQAGQSVSDERVKRELLELLKLEEQLRLEETVAARVTAESVSNFEWSVTVDKGSSSGIKIDMAVVSGDGLVGRVISVAPNASIVELIIDPDSGVAGRLASSGETGVVEGQRNQDLAMDLVSPNARVVLNEQVVTSGFQGSLYPPEIPIGFVSRVFTDPGKLNKTVAVRPAVNFSALQFVLVVTKPYKGSVD